MATPLIQIVSTPNPEALRIIPGVRLLEGPALEFSAADDLSQAPLAETLLAIDGVSGVMIATDFLTVRRASALLEWTLLKPEILMAVADFLHSGEPAVLGQPRDRAVDAGGAELIVDQIREVLDRYVRPAIARDGGDVKLIGFDPGTGVVRIHMGGACGGCPSATMTLKRGIEQTVKRYVPEVTRVEAGSETSAEADPKARFRAWLKAKWGSGQTLAADPRRAAGA
jgi:Fe-S cluster biogenesis protein NfuA